jgi:hypothetical protein
MARENKFLDEMRDAVVAQSARGRLLDIGVTMRHVNRQNKVIFYSHFLLIKKEVYSLAGSSSVDNSFPISVRNDSDYYDREAYSSPRKAAEEFYRRICSEQNDNDYRAIKTTLFVYPNKTINMEDVSSYWDTYLQNDRLVNGIIDLEYSLGLPKFLVLANTKQEPYEIRRANPNPRILSRTIKKQLQPYYKNDVLSRLALSHPKATTEDRVLYGLSAIAKNQLV